MCSSYILLIDFFVVFSPQKVELMKNIERLAFWVGRDIELHTIKNQLLTQVDNLDISVNGNGLYIMNRQYWAEVR